MKAMTQDYLVCSSSFLTCMSFLLNPQEESCLERKENGIFILSLQSFLVRIIYFRVWYHEKMRETEPEHLPTMHFSLNVYFENTLENGEEDASLLDEDMESVEKECTSESVEMQRRESFVLRPRMPLSFASFQLCCHLRFLVWLVAMLRT